MDSFIVLFWARVFGFLRWISWFQSIWSVLPRRWRTSGVVDAWVLLNLVLAVAFLFVSPVAPNTVAVILMVYGAVRVFELVIYQANVLLFDPVRSAEADKRYAIKGYRRIVILTLHGYVESVFWFALCYRNVNAHFGFGDSAAMVKAALETPIGALYYSFVTMATLGYGDFTPSDNYGRTIVICQIVAAVFLTIVVLARLIGFLPQPTSLEAVFDRPTDRA